jgi:hypothetical protein
LFAKCSGQPILSADACTELGAIVRVHAVDKPLTKDELIKDYGDVFKGLGKLPKAHHIQFDPFVEPGVLNVNNLELSLSSWMCQNP